MTDAVLGGRVYESASVPGVMAFARREGRRLVETPVPIGRRPHLLLSLRHLYRFVRTPEDATDGPWAVRSVAYSYELLDRSERQVVACHWHPEPSPAFPHLHVGRQFAHAGLPVDVGTLAATLVRAHLPTGLVALQSVLRFAITELGVEPMRADRAAILEETEVAGPQFGTSR